MSQEELQKIYDKTLENSVGNEKRCSFKKIFKNVVIKVAIITLLLTFIASSLVGCMNNNKESEIGSIESSRTEDKTTTNGFTTYQIATYGNLRLFELLNAYNFTDYSMDGRRRDYHYTEEQFSQIQELDETYLYAFYTQTTPTTLTTVCKSLGYDDLKDFLLDNGYVDDDGEPNIGVWYKHNKVEMSKIMKKAQEELNQGAR